jgi:hypothetical protein
MKKFSGLSFRNKVTGSEGEDYAPTGYTTTCNDCGLAVGCYKVTTFDCIS